MYGIIVTVIVHTEEHENVEKYSVPSERSATAPSYNLVCFVSSAECGILERSNWNRVDELEDEEATLRQRLTCLEKKRRQERMKVRGANYHTVGTP